MTDDQSEPEYIDISFMDIQGIGVIPEPVNRMAGLVTKAALGAFLAYFSFTELAAELKAYRINQAKVGNDGS